MNKTEKACIAIQKLTKEKYFIHQIEPDMDSMSIIMGNMFEELSEGLKKPRDNHEQVDYICDIVVFSLDALTRFGYEVQDLESDYVSSDRVHSVLAMYLCREIEASDFTSYLVLLIDTAIMELSAKGYEPHLVLEQCLAEISSRRQCPIQAEKGRESSEKWKKDVSDEAVKLWVKADFTKCKKQ